MEKEFRYLKNDEIEVRQGKDFKNGYVELLLYKTARVDANLLDEKFGLYGWQCDYKEVNGVVYCGIAVRSQINGEWIYKWDAGAESNFEKEKGQASDAFKRAGFRLGIGRELYTVPRIVVKADKYDTFSVREIEYEEDRISALKIVNGKGDVVFNYPGGANTRWSREDPEGEKEQDAVKDNAAKLKAFCSNEKLNPETDRNVLKKFYNFYLDKVNDFERFNDEKLWERW